MTASPPAPGLHSDGLQQLLEHGLSVDQVGTLHELFACYCFLDGTSQQLDFQEFCTLLESLSLPSSKLDAAQQQELFSEIAGGRGCASYIEFDEFCVWVATSSGPDATAIRDHVLEEDSTVWGAIVRSFTKLTRPLATVMGQIAISAKHIFFMTSKKISVALKTSIQNPSRLFRRQPLDPLDAFRGNPTGVLTALRAEMAAGGMSGVIKKSAGPYVYNCVVAMSMFHTYSTANHYLRAYVALTDDCSLTRSLQCEGAAGFAAGVVQATLSTPLYNVKWRRVRQKHSSKLSVPDDFPAGGIAEGLRALHQRRGLIGLFRNYKFVVAQEGLSLAAFFATYEYLKVHTVRALRWHVDDSGDKDMLGWVAAASGAGMVLAAVGTPFENLHEWHVARRKEHTPNNIFVHFWQSAKPRARRRILLSGLRRKLPLAPLAGLPLLAYEIMYHSGLTPALHDDTD